MELHIRYKNLPEGKVLLEKEQVKKLDVLVSGSGFNLLKANLKTNSISIDVKKAIKKSISKYAFPLKRPSVKKQLPNGLRLKQIIKDTVYIYMGRSDKKNLH